MLNSYRLSCLLALAVTATGVCSSKVNLLAMAARLVNADWTAARLDLGHMPSPSVAEVATTTSPGRTPCSQATDSFNTAVTRHPRKFGSKSAGSAAIRSCCCCCCSRLLTICRLFKSSSTSCKIRWVLLAANPGTTATCPMERPAPTKGKVTL
jgi:hypothetical protein